MVAGTAPSDSLDLQILWLSVLEQKGVRFTTEDLANAFYGSCRYTPGEHAVFRKNYARGLLPPMTGRFNNLSRTERIVAPTRSEIWACISPGNPALAAGLAGSDGVLDDSGNAVYAEQFLAALEAAAYVESDIDRLVETALHVMPINSRFVRLVKDVRRWCQQSSNWQHVRRLVIRDYGHPDCRSLFQNMGFSILALYLGNGNFVTSVMTALKCGFSTRATCATVGAILGIIHGAKKLTGELELNDPDYVPAINAPRRSGRLRDLAEDVCRMGLHVARHKNLRVGILNAPEPPVLALAAPPPVVVTVEYSDIPAIGIGETRTVHIVVANQTNDPVSGTMEVVVPEGWTCQLSEPILQVKPHSRMTIGARISVPPDTILIAESNHLRISFNLDQAEPVTRDFGIVGACVWQVFGPYWENNAGSSQLELPPEYATFLHDSECGEASAIPHLREPDAVRESETGQITVEELLAPESWSPETAREARLANIHEDLISFNSLVGFRGPCSIFLLRRFLCPEPRIAHIQIGHSDAFRLWLNGVLVVARENPEWWTGENVRVPHVTLASGENTLLVQLFRRSSEALFSAVFVRDGASHEHFFDFTSVIPRRMVSLQGS
jgi:hypothetical protein